MRSQKRRRSFPDPLLKDQEKLEKERLSWKTEGKNEAAARMPDLGEALQGKRTHVHLGKRERKKGCGLQLPGPDRKSSQKQKKMKVLTWKWRPVSFQIHKRKPLLDKK